MNDTIVASQTEYTCSSLVDPASQAACLAMYQPGKHERHMRRMTQCVSEDEPRVHIMYLVHGPDSRHLCPINNIAITAQTCEVREGHGVWHFTRVEPFSTTGGDSWTAFQTYHDAYWRHDNDRTFLSVSDHVLGSVDASGELIGYPPIHQHHFHYSHTGSP
jgi:hypothetical protein|eukprot:7389680-Prymnesium_polylepis.1